MHEHVLTRPVMREEVQIGRFPVVEIETGEGRAAREEEALLPFKEREKEVPLKRRQLIGR